MSWRSNTHATEFADLIHGGRPGRHDRRKRNRNSEESGHDLGDASDRRGDIQPNEHRVWNNDLSNSWRCCGCRSAPGRWRESRVRVRRRRTAAGRDQRTATTSWLRSRRRATGSNSLYNGNYVSASLLSDPGPDALMWATYGSTRTTGLPLAWRTSALTKSTSRHTTYLLLQRRYSFNGHLGATRYALRDIEPGTARRVDRQRN